MIDYKININEQALLNAPVPVLPAGFNRLIRALDDETINQRKLSEILTNFPSIAARLIFLANSAWAAPRVPVENLVTACTRLGFSIVRSVSISLCIASPFDAAKKCPAFDMEYFWCTSLMVAEGATLLAQAMPDSDIDAATLQTAGLLHNLGLLWLAGNWPEAVSKALVYAASDPSSTTIDALRRITGTDYCAAGGILGRAWKLPEILVSAMEQHERGTYTQAKFPSTLIVGYTAEMVAALQSKPASEQCPAYPEPARVAIDQAELGRIYQKLGDKLARTKELARTMFTNI